LRRYQVAFSADGDRLAYYTEQIQTWLDQGTYGLVSSRDGLLLLQREQPSNPQAIQDWQAFLSEVI